MEQLGRSFTLYDTCNTCTVAIYERVVIDDDLLALIVGGEPSNEELEEGRNRLIVEFAELSGDMQMTAECNRMKSIFGYRARILSLTICVGMLTDGVTEDLKKCLLQNGIKVKDDSDIEDVAKKIQSKLNSLSLMLKEEIKRQGGRTAKDGKMTRKDFNMQLVILSKHAGFRISKDITLAEYAGYIHDYNNFKSLKHGSKNI